MSESNNLPQSISHKQLSYLMLNAQKEVSFSLHFARHEKVRILSVDKHHPIVDYECTPPVCGNLPETSSKKRKRRKRKKSNNGRVKLSY